MIFFAKSDECSFPHVHLEPFGVEHIAQGHFDRWTRGARNRTTTANKRLMELVL